MFLNKIMKLNFHQLLERNLMRRAEIALPILFLDGYLIQPAEKHVIQVRL
jgi:hypothetical protein